MVTLAAPARLPLRPIGVVDDHQFGTLVADVYEHVSDLVYPHSIEMYSMMRKDPRLAAVLAGYTLQLRRAQWQLDGTGCRPEVVQLVADGMGLNVAGQDKASGARRRGVSWNEHLRAALSCLTFGHSGFELVAELVDGQARLATLAERLPQSVAGIHSDPKTGDLLGIDQMLTGRKNSPQIPADRLAWYCHEREGAAWQGVSLLRAAYAPWLIKREMMRVHAISNRRWGAGVPVMEALAGTTPTAAQMQQAQQMASAARAGDQAGAAAPPGFTLRIAGLSGAVPDTLAFMEWLNREMSSSALMEHLDLGQGGNGGSRALGEAFIGNWTLSLETIGENVADTATRQIAARIVDWNWGEDEPVPVVTVSGVGSRREVTAESLDMLLSSGALSKDPALESWVRREYRLPERTSTAPPPPAPTPPAPVAASRRAPRRSRKEPSPGQLALPILGAARQPAAQELAAGVDPAAIQQQWQQQVDELAAQWQLAADPMREEIVATITAAVAAGTLAALIGAGGLTVSPTATTGIATSITAAMLALGNASAAMVAAEVASLGITITAPILDEAALTAHAAAAAQVIVSGHVNGATQVALANAGPGVDAETVGQRVREHLDAITATAVANDPNGRGWVVGNLAAVMSQAQAMGRMAAFEALEAAGHSPAYVASEANDQGVCEPCSEIDGTRFETLAEAIDAYPIGQYVACLGGTRCRGFLFAVTG